MSRDPTWPVAKSRGSGSGSGPRTGSSGPTAVRWSGVHDRRMAPCSSCCCRAGRTSRPQKTCPRAALIRARVRRRLGPQAWRRRGTGGDAGAWTGLEARAAWLKWPRPRSIRKAPNQADPGAGGVAAFLPGRPAAHAEDAAARTEQVQSSRDAASSRSKSRASKPRDCSAPMSAAVAPDGAAV